MQVDLPYLLTQLEVAYLFLGSSAGRGALYAIDFRKGYPPGSEAYIQGSGSPSDVRTQIDEQAWW